ncbi:hypothetical protein [Nocardia asteroides]|uniref:hypothetical protein n=1 Tax=Nocardia asteroides TaxID=1824 RepID=UPI00342B7BCF
MDFEPTTTNPIISRARELVASYRNATAAAQDPDLAMPWWPEGEPLPDLEPHRIAAEENYYIYLREHRDQLGEVNEFRNSYEFLDWLAAERADLRDHQSWTCDPEQPLRRADRRRDR